MSLASALPGARFFHSAATLPSPPPATVTGPASLSTTTSGAPVTFTVCDLSSCTGIAPLLFTAPQPAPTISSSSAAQASHDLVPTRTPDPLPQIASKKDHPTVHQSTEAPLCLSETGEGPGVRASVSRRLCSSSAAP